MSTHESSMDFMYFMHEHETKLSEQGRHLHHTDHT